MLKVIKKFFADWIWQLPQNLVGLLYKYIATISNNVSDSKDYKVYFKVSKGSVSLGKYIFVYVNTGNLSRTIQHEAGHYRQSCMLGPLYLIVIGIPSITWAFLHSYIPYFRKKSYYSFYTEKWADKLAGIDRNKSSSPFHKAYIEVISLPDLESKVQHPTKSIPKTKEEKMKVYIKVCEKFDRIKK